MANLRFYSNTKNVTAHDRLKLFFDIMEHLRTGDIPFFPELDQKLKQLSYSEKETALAFFKHVVDQPTYMTADHKRLRRMLVDWYSSHRSLATNAKQYNDPYNLSNDALDELIRSFGFPYSNRIQNTDDKIAFLFGLIDLYNHKGTPKTLATALQFFGLTNIRISEWWIKKGEGTNFFVENMVVWPQNYTQDNPIQIPYETFFLNDPYWQVSKTELIASYNTSVISLPSITPHISIDASVPFINTYMAIAVLTKEMQESYEHWAAGGELDKSLSIEKYGVDVSFLELALSIMYVFNYGLNDADTFFGDRLFMYQGNVMDSENRISYDINTIQDLFDSYVKRPLTRAQQKTLRTGFLNNFTASTSSFFIQSYGDIKTYLQAINEDLYDSITEDLAVLDTATILDSMLDQLDRWIFSGALLPYYFSYVTVGTSIYERIKPIIEFFKPYRARIREFLTALLVQNPLEDSMMVSDIGFYNSSVDFEIYQQIIDELELEDDAEILPKMIFESYVHDDVFDAFMTDAVIEKINMMLDGEDNVSDTLEDNLEVTVSGMYFADAISRGAVFDNATLEDEIDIQINDLP